MLPSRWIALLVLLTSMVPFAAQTPQLDRSSRLEILAEVWSKTYIYHPRVASGELDYNSVLLKAIPLVEQTTSDAEFVRILKEQLLVPLRDAQTSAQLATLERCGQPPSGAPQEAQALKLSPEVGFVRIRDGRIEAERIKPFLDRFRSAVDSLGNIEKLVVDLRYEVDADVPAWTSYWFGLFTDRPLDQAHYLRRVHEGLNEFNSPNNAYRQRWQVDGGDVLARAMWDGVIRKPILTPVLFLVNNASYPRLARTLDTLQRAGRAAVLWEDSGCVTSTSASSFSTRPDVETYPGNIRVYVNAQLLLGGEAPEGARPDKLSVTRVPDDRILALADEMLTGLSPRGGNSLTIPPLRLQSYVASAESLTNRHQRLFWMIKVWMAVQYFFPHLEYASIDWTKALPDWIPRFEAASNDEEFFDVLRQMTAPLNDSHIRVFAPNGHPSRSQFFPPVRIGRVEGTVIVTAVEGEANGEVIPGDEVVSIDGRTVEQTEAYMRARVSASTQGAFNREWNRQTGGKRETEVELALNRNSIPHIVKLRRTLAQPLSLKFSPYRVLSGGIDYINPFMFQSERELEAAFNKVRGSRGLIIDLRGYPNYPGVRLFLVQRFYNRPVKSGLSEVPLVQRHSWGPYLTYVDMFDYIQPIAAEHYAGPVVVLINAETQSSPESICLDLTSDHRVTFVGSPTAGTTGGTTVLNLPGGWWLEFTGTREMYSDGRRFQNIGIVPDVHAEPTIRGVAMGKDEVFEKGVEVLLSKVQSLH